MLEVKSRTEKGNLDVDGGEAMLERVLIADINKRGPKGAKEEAKMDVDRTSSPLASET